MKEKLVRLLVPNWVIPVTSARYTLKKKKFWYILVPIGCAMGTIDIPFSYPLSVGTGSDVYPLTAQYRNAFSIVEPAGILPIVIWPAFVNCSPTPEAHNPHLRFEYRTGSEELNRDILFGWIYPPPP